MKVMFIDSGRADVVVWELDLETEKVTERIQLKGSAKLVVDRVKTLIETHKPDNLVVDKTGFGFGYHTSITRHYKKIKDGEK
jgi:hypothetical protein